jgi:hypothetical protein
VELPELLRSMKGDTDMWDRDTCACAKGFYSVLQELYFNFLLDIFPCVLPKSATILNATSRGI